MKLEDFVRFVYRIFWRLFHSRYYKNPENYIPKNTIYCYDYTGKMTVHDKVFGEGGKLISVFPFEFPETRSCIFHNELFHIDLCMYDGGDCVMDACKTCGISEGFEQYDT